MINCIFCNGKVERKCIEREFVGKKVMCNAFVCEKCGEMYFSSQEAKRIEKIVTGDDAE